MMYKIIQRFKDWIRWGQLFGGVPRSPKWPTIRNDFLILHDKCEVCGKKGSLLKPLEIHHCIPFSQDKSKELDFENLITLCRRDHLLIGHLDNWKSFNKDVKIDSNRWRLKINNRPL